MRSVSACAACCALCSMLAAAPGRAQVQEASGRFRIRVASVMSGTEEYRIERSPEGWQVSGMYIYQSGAPLAWQDVIFDGNPDDIRKGPRTVDRWFNVDAGFSRDPATRPSYHYRTWPFYLPGLRRHASNNVDLSVSKRWRLSERGIEFQLRGDALNAFNHPLFGAPDMNQFSAAFGQITTTSNYPRQLQLVFRLSY